MTSTEGILTSARYGKDQVRVFRVVRNGAVHEIVEYNVQVLLEGDIATRYDRLPDLEWWSRATKC